ncbi:DUF6270 domain-containing protein [Rothia sp. P7181]|uniref:DUF6270 domain-containing protein n=1 Tax=unclassified Rothia (in: high G+C Gram-positive bacteria) TaxID=2689056 RepID=UPI003AC0BFDD
MYGSCVSRDTFELVPAQDYKILNYVARQSVIAMSRDASELFPSGVSFSSKFQQRMVEGDWQGNAWQEITSNKDNIDLLIWDIFDERHGAYRFDNGATVTRSSDLLGSELTEHVSQAFLFVFGTDRHFNFWKYCVGYFVKSLKNARLFDKTVVIKVPWAEYFDSGESTPSSMGTSAKEANNLYARYYDFLESLGFHMVDLSDYPVRAEPLHQWGKAPFHYTLDVYQEIIRQLQELGFLPHPEKRSQE